jgi:hypothetical protein
LIVAILQAIYCPTPAFFKVAKTDNSQVLANVTRLPISAATSRPTPHWGTMHEVGNMADVNLAADTFHRQFPDTLTISAATELLPDMQGSEDHCCWRMAA